MATVRPITPTFTDIENRMKDMLELYVHAFNDHNADMIMKMYAPDAIALAPNRPMLNGPKAIIEMHREFFNMECRNMKMNTTHIFPETNLVTTVGTYSIDFKLPNGTMTTDLGKFVCISKLQPNGDYKYFIDTWNSDLPPTT